MRPEYRSSALLTLALTLTGCSANFAPQSATSTQASMGSIHGIVHGGRQPIIGAHIYALQASTTAYSTPTAPAPSTSLITVGTATYPIATDTGGGPTNSFNYVTTDASGGFNLAFEQNTCTSGSVVYLYALGGNPGAGTNSASGLLAVLGVCPASGFLSDTVSGGVDIDELTTVAAAYTLAPFATDALHIGAPSATDTLALIGIENAANTAGQLVNLTTGGANATTPGGSGTVPVNTIDTLGNILAACVNSAGSGSSACSTIFTNVHSSGTTGTTATDTATAAIYMAQNPAIASYVIPPAMASPYQPSLSTAPNDYTLGIVYPVGPNPLGIAIDAIGDAWVTSNNNNSTPGSTTGGGGLFEISPAGVILSPNGGFTSGGISQPVGVAIDQAGSVWVTDTSSTGGLVKLTSAGGQAAGSPHYANGNLIQPLGVAIDAAGNAWVTDPGQGVVDKLSSGGSLMNGYPANFVQPVSLAFDHTGNVWIADPVAGSSGTGAIFELTSTGSYSTKPGVNGLSGGGIAGPYALAIDSTGKVWVPNSGVGATAGTTVTEISNAGNYLSPNNGFSGGGLNGPVAAAIDGNGNVWASNQGSDTSVSELNNAGAPVSGAAGFTAGGTLAGPGGIAIDGSGNVWIANSAHSSVTELIGAAVPVATPLCAGLASTTTTASKP